MIFFARDDLKEVSCEIIKKRYTKINVQGPGDKNSQLHIWQISKS